MNGCEGFTHHWEGRDSFGEGVSWAQKCSWEVLPCVEIVFVWFMKYGLHGKPYAYFAFFGRYKEVYGRGGLLISLEETCYKWKIVYVYFRDMTFSSWRAHLHPMFLILMSNQCVKPWEGLWCVCDDQVWNVSWWCVNHLCLVFPISVGGLLEA